MGKLKDQLAGIAALIAAVVAIGGGFATYGKLTEKISMLEEASKTVDHSIVAVLEEKIQQLEAHEHEHEHEHGHTKILVNEKQIELLQVKIEEIKVSTSNPLAN